MKTGYSLWDIKTILVTLMVWGGRCKTRQKYVKDIKEITYWHDYLGKKTKTKYDNNKLVIKPKLFNMNG